MHRGLLQPFCVVIVYNGRKPVIRRQNTEARGVTFVCNENGKYVLLKDGQQCEGLCPFVSLS